MKRLFFSAALAIVAIGGAFASNTVFATYYTASGSPVNCQPIVTAITCSSLAPLYNSADPETRTQIPNSQLNGQYKQP